jgi:hypothetical protein
VKFLFSVLELELFHLPALLDACNPVRKETLSCDS